MKSLLFVLLTLSSTMSFGQVEVEFLNDLGSGKFGRLSSHLADQIELCINDIQQVVSREEATKRIRQEIGKRRITKYKLLHSGKSADANSSYRVARIAVGNKIYRVFAYVEKSSGKSKIKEVRIDQM